MRLPRDWNGRFFHQVTGGTGGGGPLTNGLRQGVAVITTDAGHGATRDPVAVGFIFQVPPAPVSILADTRAFALNFGMDTDAPKIAATDARYTESSLSFMTPPEAGDLSALRGRGARLMIHHGVSDGVFSTDDTTAWYDRLRDA